MQSSSRLSLFVMVSVQDKVTRYFETSWLENRFAIKFSNFDASRGCMHPRWCYCLCNASSCTSHVYNGTPSKLFLDIQHLGAPSKVQHRPHYLIMRKIFSDPQIAGYIFSKTVSMCSSLLAPKSAILLLVFNLVTFFLKFFG